MKKRIREDVIDVLNVRAEELGLSDPVALMGSPSEVVADFSANLGLPVKADQMLDRIKQLFRNLGIIKQWIVELLL